MYQSVELAATTTDSRRAFRAIEAAEVLAQCFSFKVGELGELIQEGEIDSVGGTVALLGDD